jgi:hypothetical protein
MTPTITKDDIIRSIEETNWVLSSERISMRGFAAGGCIRDLAYGLPIKDVDILIPCGPDKDEKDMFSLMEHVAKEIRAVFGYAVAIAMAYQQTSSELSETQGSDFNERLYGVIQVRSNFPRDIIFSRCSNMREVVASFDCNINAGWMNQKGAVVYTKPDNLEWWKPITDSRRQRMLNKWEQICSSGIQ